ncbi:MAG TPA: rhamnan synthesis F family protein [Candidatus Microsaccharimonas sp.]|jgi:lipopolysaccharide biosynthesis protein
MLGGVKRKLRRGINIPNDLVVEMRYAVAIRSVKKQLKQRNNRGDAAIVLHLYYQDMWPYFSKKISLLMKKNLDLVISLPTKDNISHEILKEYPQAIILRVPNKGRDVLAFLKIGKFLNELNYGYILKLHSKRSPQRKDGQDWADKMITDLIPKTDKRWLEIKETLMDPKSALIGPEGNYVPLTTYYNDNQPKVIWMLSEMIGHKSANYINKYNKQFGFFAGTMLWLRLDAIAPLFSMGIWANNFPPESAQLDGTVAHAIERVLCVLPEYNKMKIYEMGTSAIKNIPYKTDFIPEWSDYYHVKQSN